MRHQEVPHRRPSLTERFLRSSWRWAGLTTHQLLSAPDGVALAIRSRGRRLNEAIDWALAVPADEAPFFTAAVGHRPHSSARAGPESLLGSRPPLTGVGMGGIGLRYSLGRR